MRCRILGSKALMALHGLMNYCHELTENRHLIGPGHARSTQVRSFDIQARESAMSDQVELSRAGAVRMVV
jgi:hypothetical protein